MASSAGVDGSGVSSSSPQAVSTLPVPSPVRREGWLLRHRGLPHHLADNVKLMGSMMGFSRMTDWVQFNVPM